MGPPQQLRVRLLGGLDIDGLPERAIGSRKARTLVKVLALGRGTPVSADAVALALWPNEDVPAKPVDQIGVLVSRLRAVLGSERLIRSDAGWALAVDWLDVVELEDRVEEAAARLAAGSPTAARVAARAALTLVRGELLADEVDPVWAEADRAAVARAVARARLVAAEAALAAGDPGDAASVAEGALDFDPYDEAALRILMRAHAAAGRPASALASYARARERLSEDLGVDPVKETEELHTAILLGDVSVTPVPPVPSDAGRNAIVGRSAELAALDAHLAMAQRGDAVAVLVEGEAGIGKTALIGTWMSEVATRSLVLVGRCDELGRGLPLQPVLDGLTDHLRRLSDEETAMVLGDEAWSLAPMLGPVAGGRPTGTQPTTVTDPTVGQALLFADLLAVMQRAGGDRPVVLVVEDVHLAAPSTIEWLRYAVHRGERLLVVASRRPHEGTAFEGAQVIVLGPLDLAAVTALVGSNRAADLHERSGGNPLFLVELAAAGEDELPANVREAVAARVDQLGDAATTLRAAAVLGSEVDVDLLAGVLDATVTALLEHLEAGVRSRIIEERAGTLAFRHELVREALEAGTTAARRAFVHREAARVLHDRSRHDPMQVAWHARRGGDLDTATAALIDAAATATSRFDNALADQLLSEAIELVDNVAARTARALVRIAALHLEEAEVDAERALELGGGAPALEVAGWAAYYRRDYELARRRAEEAASRTDDPGVRASCLTLSGRILHSSGHLVDARSRLVEAVDSAPNRVRGVAQVFLGGLLVHQGDVVDGSVEVDRALVDPSRLSHPFALHHGYLFRVLALGMQGRPLDALAAADAGMRVAVAARESGGARFVAVHDNTKSWVLRNLGAFGPADECTERALDLARAQRSTMSEMYYASCLDRAEARLMSNDFDGASERLDEIDDVRQWAGGHAWHHQQRYAVLRARVNLAGGEHAVAAELAATVIADSMHRDTLRYRSFAAATGAMVQFALGEKLDVESVDRVLVDLDRCAGLEAWRVTAELAAASGLDHWWRDAERRAGALIANSGEYGEGLRRYVAATFNGLQRGR